ncbi:MAG TPA: ferritin-like domain-containing protein [Methylophilaceae bacterium]|nr:ferritin-like domain-containing protein [Methylotenera sp.]HSH73373.1 ferritin-like domain-containing protein [Methylophilaceae bacterium]
MSNTLQAVHTADEAFKIDIQAIRNSARKHVMDGAQTAGYSADSEIVIKHLNAALATEIVCSLRYKRHYYTATGLNSKAIAEEFNIHAQEEQAHADLIAERIVQLGGDPDFAPDSLVSRSHADYVPCTDLQEMIKENLVAERIAIDVYHELITYIGESDSTTRRLLEGILATEEEHADELADWLKRT